MAGDANDYFTFSLPAKPNGGLVRIQSLYVDTDLDLIVSDDAGNFVGIGASLGNMEQVSLAGLPAGEYSIRVVGTPNPNYTLILDPGLNQAPKIEVQAPASTTWIERGLENPPVKWSALDPEDASTEVSLSFARERTLDSAVVVLPTYQRLDGATGLANINTHAFELGEWFVHADVSDGSGLGGAWAPGSFVIYVKGDVNFDGLVDQADTAVVRRALRHHTFESGWNVVLDMDRNGKLDGNDWRTWRQLSAEGRPTHSCVPGFRGPHGR
jgi:hypothetical protein